MQFHQGSVIDVLLDTHLDLLELALDIEIGNRLETLESICLQHGGHRFDADNLVTFALVWASH
jgi:hypothetical protein